MAKPYLREEIKAGATILVSAAVLVAAVVLVGRGGFEVPAKQYRIQFAGVGGLEEGAQVRFGGVRVGRVLRITPPGADSPRVQVLIGVRKDVVLRPGTEAAISTLGLVGEHYIELTNPRPGAGELPPGALITARDQPSMAELLQSAREVGEAARGLMGRVQAVVDGPVSDFLQRTSQMVATGDRVLRGVDQTLSEENREQLRRALANAGAILEENREQLRRALADAGALLEESRAPLRGALTDARAILEENRAPLRGALADARALLEESRAPLRGALADARALLEENRAPLRAAVEDLRALLRRVDAMAADGGRLAGRAESTLAAGEALLRKVDAAVDEEGGDLKGSLLAMKAALERARDVLENLDGAVTNFDRAVTGNLDAVEETLANLRRATQHARELTQSLKERPWQVLFPEPLRDRDAAR